MTKTNNEEKKAYEERLRRRLKILQQQFQDGKIHIAEGLKVEESLLAVRTGPDGEIDLDTVDGVVRSMALAVTHMHDREELKKSISLSEIQNTYFKFIDQNFGHYYKLMVERKLSPHDAGMAAKNSEASINEITDNLDETLNVIEKFWEGVGEIAHIHVEDMHGNVKGIFGGDLFPTHDENIASKCGIYTDTIILPDPFIRSKHVFQHYTPADKVYYFIKHAMNVMQYKDLACADVKIPIVVILPDLAAFQEEEFKFFHQLGEQDSLVHSAKLFGRQFESFEELMDFCQSLDTIERTVAEIADGNRVLFDTDWKGDTASKIENAMKSNEMKPFGDIAPGTVVAIHALGRMSVSNELLVKSRRLNGTPIIEAPTSWQYLVWKMEYDADRAEETLKSQDLHIVKGLNDLAGTDMQWLGNVPPEALIELRKEGAMTEVRNILGNGINGLIEVNSSNFHRSRDHIFDNINNAFHQHQKNIDELSRKKWKFAGKDIGSWLAVGSIDVAAALIGTPVWGMATLIANQVTDVPKIKDIPKSIRDLADQNNQLKKSPVGMLFNIRKKNS